MERRSGGFRLPIPTDELTRLIEEEADDLDLYADLPEGVEGLTDFFSARRPNVRIAERLAAPRYGHRQRTTLAHEYGHVRFHAPLWRKDGGGSREHIGTPSWSCTRNNIVDARRRMTGWNGKQVTFVGRY